jgi:glycosyltransferase involved in cell wall biosynthesis
VRAFLQLPNVTLKVLENSIDFNWRATRDLSAILNECQPEIMHLHFTGFLGIYPWLARMHSVRSVFFTDHTSRPTGYVPVRAPLWKRVAVRAINYPLSRVICGSSYGFHCMASLDILPADRFKLVYNAVDLSRAVPSASRAEEFRRRFGITNGRTTVVQVSWMIPEKGIPDLLNAAKLVLEKNQNVQFILVGEGAYRQQYMEEAQALGLGDHITWTGLIQDPFSEGVYDVADVVCQVSRWEELFGLLKGWLMQSQ